MGPLLEATGGPEPRFIAFWDWDFQTGRTGKNGGKFESPDGTY